MMNEKPRPHVGDIIVKSVGYSMVLYDFYVVTNITEKSIFLQKVKKTYHAATTDGFRPLVVPVPEMPIGRVERKALTSYYGSIWDGQPCQEDHLD